MKRDIILYWFIANSSLLTHESLLILVTKYKIINSNQFEANNKLEIIFSHRSGF